MRSPLSLAALGSTQPNLFRVWIVRLRFFHPSSSRPSHKKTFGPCSFPQNRTVPLPAFGKKGGAATADSPCSCVAESRDFSDRSTLHVGERYPAASSSSWCCTSFRMNIAILRSSFPLLLRTWLYAPLIIVQLLSTSVHVVSPGYVNTFEASSLPACAAMSTSGITSGSRLISVADSVSPAASRRLCAALGRRARRLLTHCFPVLAVLLTRTDACPTQLHAVSEHTEFQNTLSACGRLLFPPFVQWEASTFLSDITLSTLPAPYD